MSHISPLHVYTMKFTDTITFTFPNVPQLGNSLIYVWSMMGEAALPGTQDNVGIFYNDGSGLHDHDSGSLSIGDYSPAANTGGNGATTAMYWTQCVQDTFASVTIGGALANSGMGSLVTSYLTIYEVEGLIGQTPGIPTSTNFAPSFDWKPDHTNAQSIVTVADGSFIALGEHMIINPGTEDCDCPPPSNCGDNDQQAKFTLGANFATVITNCAIPDVDFFNVVDPCDPAYVSNDFVFAVCSNGAANALTLTDNIQGTWVIDYQIDGQIFGHVEGTTPPAGQGQMFTLSALKLSDDTNPATAINSTYCTYGFVNSTKATQNPLLGFHRKRFSEIQMNINGSGQETTTLFPNYILKKDLTFNPFAYTVPPIILQTDPPDDIVRPVNSVGNRVYVMFSTNAIGASFSLSKTILVGIIDSYNTVNPNAG